MFKNIETVPKISNPGAEIVQCKYNVQLQHGLRQLQLCNLIKRSVQVRQKHCNR